MSRENDRGRTFAALVLAVSIRSRLDEPGELARDRFAQHHKQFQSAPGSMSRENHGTRPGGPGDRSFNPLPAR